MNLKPGIKFRVSNPHQFFGPTTEYELLRTEGKQCVCLDLSTRHVLMMPSAFVRSKLANTNKKTKS